MVRFDTEILSKAGGREQNEDYCGYLSLDQAACWVLADGLGGHGGGEIASEIAVKTVLDAFQRSPECSTESLLAYMEKAAESLRAQQSEDLRLAQMRTTAVVLVSDFASALWAHMGDSRLYYLRQGGIAFQTRDDSVPQALSNAGKIRPDEIRFHPDRNRLLRALGNNSEAKPSVERRSIALISGDAFLLCSDGFWEYVTETEMEADFARSPVPGEWLARMEQRLLRRALVGHDNYSALGIFVV